jgi:3-oxoacyl-[acyl-carrier-protein] synthase-3
MSGLPRGVLGVSLTSDGSAYAHIGITAGGSRTPISAATRPDELLMELRDGRAVFTRAVDMMARSSRAALAQAGLTLGDVDHFVPHQANQRIVDATRQRLGIDSGRTRCHSSLALHANSSAATIPLTLSLAAEAAELRAGEVVLMCAAGAGLTGGAVVYRL